MKVEQAGDQCTLGCNFDTKRPLIYKAVLGHVFGPTAYAGRLLRFAVMLDRSDRRCELPDGDAQEACRHRDYARPAGGLRVVLEDLHC